MSSARYSVERTTRGFRIVDAQTQSSVASCFLQSNAELVARALNLLGSADPNQLDFLNPSPKTNMELLTEARNKGATVGHDWERAQRGK